MICKLPAPEQTWKCPEGSIKLYSKTINTCALKGVAESQLWGLCVYQKATSTGSLWVHVRQDAPNDSLFSAGFNVRSFLAVAQGLKRGAQRGNPKNTNTTGM